MRASKSIENVDSIVLADYVVKARNRIEKQLWSSRSTPTIIFLDGQKVFGLLDYNQYGSSITLPHKTCLLIGPKGANIDVVAHELVHADIADTLGYWTYSNFPAWINEGVAMQVDLRKRYDPHAINDIDPEYVTLKNNSNFYTGNDVTQNYAAAKHLIGQWIEANGIDQLLLQLLTKKPESF